MASRRLRVLIALTAAALLFAWAPASALARMLPSDAPSVIRASSVIVQVTNAAHMAAVRTAIELDGGFVSATMRWNAFFVAVPDGSDPAAFAALIRSVPGVSVAQANSKVRAAGTIVTTNDPQYGRQWGLPAIGAPAAWSQSEGSGVSVAVIDTGIDPAQPDLAGQVVLFRNYVTVGASAADDEGHGTHVSGIIAAIRNNGVEGSGTAPKAKLYAFKVLDSTGSGDDYAVAQAIRDAVDLTPCKIISMSLG
ncbi:MAG TPA: S8 family serine peptidase, partial [Coriobacteriia bacterium]